jgi:hypothetical protein
MWKKSFSRINTLKLNELENIQHGKKTSKIPLRIPRNFVPSWPTGGNAAQGGFEP